MTKILTTTMLALAGVVITEQTASAQLSYNQGDIVVAFHGGSQTYLIDIGPVTQFQTGSLVDGNVHALSIGNIATDLGSGVAATGWSLQGSAATGVGSPSTGRKVWISQEELTPGTASDAPLNDSITSLAVPVNNITAMGTVYAQGTATVNNTKGNKQANSTVGSYDSFQIGGSQGFNAPYNYFQTPIEGAFTLGTDSSVLDLYQQASASGSTNPAALLGAFQVTSGGVLNFSSDVTDFAPVPEPATFAFGFAMLGACAVGRFRTRRSADVATA